MTDEIKDMAAVTQPEDEAKEATHSELPTGEETPVAEDAPKEDAPAEPEADEPPPVVGDQDSNPDPTYLGHVEKAEQDTIIALQRNHQQIVFQLGNMVLRIFESVNQVGGIEDQIQNTYQAIGKRLNIGPKTRWSVMQDGSVRLLPEQPGPQIVPPPAESDKSEE